MVKTKQMWTPLYGTLLDFGGVTALTEHIAVHQTFTFKDELQLGISW